MGCHFLLQGIFPTQESNLGVSLALQADSLSLSCQGSYFETDIRACKTEKYCLFPVTKNFVCCCYLVTELCLSTGILCSWISQARILKWAAISSSRDLHDSGIEPMFLVSLALTDHFFSTEPPGNPCSKVLYRSWLEDQDMRRKVKLRVSRKGSFRCGCHCGWGCSHNS